MLSSLFCSGGWEDGPCVQSTINYIRKMNSYFFRNFLIRSRTYTVRHFTIYSLISGELLKLLRSLWESPSHTVVPAPIFHFPFSTLQQLAQERGDPFRFYFNLGIPIVPFFSIFLLWLFLFCPMKVRWREGACPWENGQKGMTLQTKTHGLICGTPTGPVCLNWPHLTFRFTE